MDDKIWRVVRIISDYRIVINGGSNQGLKIDDELEIFEPGEEILDTITNESLGTLDFIKSYIRVENIYPNMSICISNEEKVTTMQEALLPFTKAISVQPQKLPVEPTEISGRGKEFNKRIRLNDQVRKKPI